MGFFLLLLLLMVILFPPLIFPLLVMLGVFLLVFIPFKFAFNSIVILLSAPGQIYQIATNKLLRKNHALEHATINVLEEKYGRGLFFSGLAKENGFFIRGQANPLEVEEAAREGLIRLQQGEENLAIHTRCGTTILVVNLLSSMVFLVILFGLGAFSLLYVIMAVLLANLVGPSLGVSFQRWLTTSAKVRDMVIKGVENRSPKGIPSPGWFFIHTAFLRTLN